MMKKQYPTDLTENQWIVIRGLLPQAKSGTGKRGRRANDLRKMLNGVFYVSKTGCQWRMLPHDFGPWNTVYQYFSRWSKNGLWQKILDSLRELERICQDKKPSASGTCVDSQSVKTITQGKEVGYDGNKKVDGRKRHILVDTLGIIICVVVTAANVGDREGLKKLLKKYAESGFKRLRKIWVDSGYFGKEMKAWVESLKKTYKIRLEVTGATEKKGFQLEKKRWVVERTFAWLFNYRRNSKDYETLPQNSESMLMISMIQILLRRFP